MLEFKYGDYKVLYPRTSYHWFLKEVLVYDVYRSDLLRKDNTVLDLGATVGEFSILASKKVGTKGKVIAIEPNIDDYNLLVSNIKRNNCQNVIPVNLGVGAEVKEAQITFQDRSFICKINTVENILNELNINATIDFVKMDIEGFEVGVLDKSIDVMKKASVISIECHNTKEIIDEKLFPHGFFFQPVDSNYLHRKLIKYLALHPSHFLKGAFYALSKNPRLALRVLSGYDIVNDPDNNPMHLVVGSYIKKNKPEKAHPPCTF